MKKITLFFILLFQSSILLNSVTAQKYDDYFPELNKFYSIKPLGATIENDSTVFRLFSTGATEVRLVLFAAHDDTIGTEYLMCKDQDNVWEYKIAGTLRGKYYGYRLAGAANDFDMYDDRVIIADPFARAVVTQNNYHHPGKSIIIDTNYNWESDTWSDIPLADLVIYEMHIRDLTAHPSSGIDKKGTYSGAIESGKTGGLSYLLDLGINAVELLPVHDFANIEIPYNDPSAPVLNTWNPYARNHWGYMTSYFFAPESYYASDGNMTPQSYNGIQGQQVKEFKDMIKTLHKHGIAVLLDVVYNHVSQYDYNPFKYIDKKYFFRLDSSGNFLSHSGCGNDFMTERPMARRLIIESVKYWMTEYHIDGFRFDLANLIDDETCKEILREAREINPNVYIIAEPWGDGYNPAGFSKLGWAAWNDKFRNGVKGQNPFDNPGFIFGRWERENNRESIKRYVSGSVAAVGGQFQEASHSINYLESHDDHTLGDFIRIGSGAVHENQRVQMQARLSEKQMRLNKLAALFLFTAQGPLMIGQGQEFARSKVIAPTTAPDTNQGKIDHNSYNKDNETNYINYLHKELNDELYQYYKGLIALRKTHPGFRRARVEDIHFLPCENDFGLGFYIDKKYAGDSHDIIVLMNGNWKEPAMFTLPTGLWHIIVNEATAGTTIIKKNLCGNLKIPPTSGMVLLK